MNEGSREKAEPPKVVTQIMLARIQQLESAVEYYRQEVMAARTLERKNVFQRTVNYYQEEFRKNWRELRKLMLDGAKIERGPIRAFLKRTNSRLTLVVK